MASELLEAKIEDAMHEEATYLSFLSDLLWLYRQPIFQYSVMYPNIKKPALETGDLGQK